MILNLIFDEFFLPTPLDENLFRQNIFMTFFLFLLNFLEKMSSTNCSMKVCNSSDDTPTLKFNFHFMLSQVCLSRYDSDVEQQNLNRQFTAKLVKWRNNR